MNLPESVKRYIYYQEEDIVLLHGDCLEIMPQIPNETFDLIVTDPPYNVGYHYETYKDDLEHQEYLEMIVKTTFGKSVLIHYPEESIQIALAKNEAPHKCVAWVYNANTPKQWRLISWFNVMPDFSKEKQPYKNINDKRIKELLSKGSRGTNIYDWWNIEQVKNVSCEKTKHPCQIPLNVKKRIIKITEGNCIIDPFLGSGTTAVAAKELGRKCIGIELDAAYLKEAVDRLKQETLF